MRDESRLKIQISNAILPTNTELISSSTFYRLLGLYQSSSFMKTLTQKVVSLQKGKATLKIELR